MLCRNLAAWNARWSMNDQSAGRRRPWRRQATLEAGPASQMPTQGTLLLHQYSTLSWAKRYAPTAGLAHHYDSAVSRIAYLGPRGTFTEEALLTQSDFAGEVLIPLRSVGDVIAAVESGKADLSVVPIENSIEGSVTVTLDALAFDTDLLIQREIVLPISLALCAKKGVKRSEIRTVLSHPHAIAQCRGWLAAKVPEAVAQAANSTADAAEQVSKSRRGGMAAVSTNLAASIYGLKVLAAEIEDHPENQTRFVAIGRGIPAPTGHDKTSIVCFQREDRPGSLLSILHEFAARAINLTKLESRPTKAGLGDYCFFIDCEGHISDELLADALRTLAAKQANVKFLGSFPAAGGHDAHSRRTAASKSWRAAERWIEDLRAQTRQSGEDFS